MACVWKSPDGLKNPRARKLAESGRPLPPPYSTQAIDAERPAGIRLDGQLRAEQIRVAAAGDAVVEDVVARRVAAAGLVHAGARKIRTGIRAGSAARNSTTSRTACVGASVLISVLLSVMGDNQWSPVADVELRPAEAERSASMPVGLVRPEYATHAAAREEVIARLHVALRGKLPVARMGSPYSLGTTPSAPCVTDPVTLACVTRNRASSAPDIAAPSCTAACRSCKPAAARASPARPRSAA